MALAMQRDLREGGVIAELALHNEKVLDLNLNLHQTPKPKPQNRKCWAIYGLTRGLWDPIGPYLGPIFYRR